MVIYTFINILNIIFEIKKTNEGCISDFIIRDKTCIHSDDNNWIRIQLKSTLSCMHCMYSFHINNNYQDHILMCNCIDDDKLWILPYSAFSHLKKHLCISSNKSKYNKYLVSRENAYEQISVLIKSMNTFTSKECLIPISKTQHQELDYANIRIQSTPFLQYLKPNIENGKVDFYINNMKFQEKVSCLKRSKHNIICLYVNNGKEHNVRKYRMYRIGENDFYWFHIKDTLIFYVVPELVLFQHKYLSNIHETLTRKMLNIDTNGEWLNDYRFDYKNVDKTRLLYLLQLPNED